MSKHATWPVSRDFSWHGVQNQDMPESKPVWVWSHLKMGHYSSWEPLVKQSGFSHGGNWLLQTFQGQHSWKKPLLSTQNKPEEQARASGTHTSLSRVRNIWLMTLSEKKVMASHCTKDGEKMEQRPSPVLAERKRTVELSPHSSPHAHHQAGKLLCCNILALTSILITQLSLQIPGRDTLGATKVLPCDLPHSSEGSWDISLTFEILQGATPTSHRREKKRRETAFPDLALRARLPSVWLCRAPSGLPSQEGKQGDWQRDLPGRQNFPGQNQHVTEKTRPK